MRVVSAICVAMAIAASSASAAIRPVVLLHGVTKSYKSMDSLKTWIEADYPGIYVHNADIPTQNNPHGGIDSVLYSMESQVEILAAQLRADGNLTNGFDMVCHSQGGLTCRAYIQKYGGSLVHNYVSLAGPHQGVYGVPELNALCPDVECPWLNDLVDAWTEKGWAEPLFQKYISAAQYWKNPLNYSLYLTTSAYLPDVNNERAAKNPLYKQNLLAMTGNLTLVMALLDTVVVPKESAHFSFFTIGQDVTLQAMEDTAGYMGDWVGIKSMNEAGRLERPAVNCTHTGLVEAECKSEVYETIIKPRVGGQLP